MHNVFFSQSLCNRYIIWQKCLLWGRNCGFLWLFQFCQFFTWHLIGFSHYRNKLQISSFCGFTTIPTQNLMMKIEYNGFRCEPASNCSLRCALATLKLNFGKMQIKMLRLNGFRVSSRYHAHPKKNLKINQMRFTTTKASNLFFFSMSSQEWIRKISGKIKAICERDHEILWNFLFAILIGKFI